ncbi:ancient ubiquitous protein 1 [Lingula anatina]|uniref:Lipid droplet-regulating VLDL assembly factor AUP1 n=1 Tax=Lingula anatina TaxID=7574 RepID=A0A1S3H109_LINAN|nr:ancient ubiquitous protein 1 [Lingula anatina]|eukprot:XP_013379693.1 ancient ubiquitous protein 1 [Lingula anatina]
MVRSADSVMSQVRIEDLFNDSRFPSGAGVIGVVLYFPVGLLLAVLRFFIGLHTYVISCILPKSSIIRSCVFRVMYGILGIVVTVTNPENRDKRCKVIVTNFVSSFDRTAVDLVYPAIMPSVWDLPPLLNWMLGYSNMGVKQGRDILIRNAKKHLLESNLPVLAHPEGASTNGKVGMLKFSVWPFSLEDPVQPILISVQRPIPIAASVLGGRWWLDVFWSLFVPYTHFKLRVLPTMEAQDEESVEDFTKRVQQVMAEELGITATNFSSADKVEYAKRKLIVQPDSSTNSRKATDQQSQSSQVAPPSSPGADTRLHTMAMQVREVLPHVPIEVIKRDLGTTRDVDTTITNILEGRVKYEPESERTQSSSRPQVKPTPVSPSSNAAKSFSRSPQERTLSLNDRKQALLENARRRYLQKNSQQQ